MDLTTTKTTVTVTSSTDTAPQPPTKSSLSYAPTPYRAPSSVVYKQCLKNHAAAMGRLALDGCGEFSPSDPLKCAATDPSMLKCAACGCHRNFHRRVDRHPVSPELSPSPPSHRTLMALSAAAGEEQQIVSFASPETPKGESNPRERKRFRTKFSTEQKEEMLRFSERVEWVMRRVDDVAVAEFCNKIGVSREVLKVWMHNNKHTNNKIKVTTTNNNNNKLQLSNNNSEGNSNGINADGSSSSA